MSEAASPGQGDGQQPAALAAAEAARRASAPGRGTVAAPGREALADRSRRRWARWTAVAVVIVLAAGGAGAAWRAGLLKAASPAAGGPGTAAPPATKPVLRETLTAQTPESATLGYAASYTVTGKGSGTLTWLPSAGTVIRQGTAAYQVDGGTPVVLMYGREPAWRSMSEGTTGSDVTQLNHDLVSLGYGNSADISSLGWDYYSWETQYAVELLEEALGVSSPSGSLSLGSVVFAPEALRVATATAGLGSPASGPILTATSDRHIVTISLSTSQEGQVKAGDAVTVTLPDGSATPGVVTSVGTVASGPSTAPTIPVYVRLTHPRAAGNLDQAPVTVNITTATAPNALVVPVGALLAQSSGGYAVEVIGAGNTRHLVPVTVGIFDDTDELVQVTGALTPGEQVSVPAS